MHACSLPNTISVPNCCLVLENICKMVLKSKCKYRWFYLYGYGSVGHYQLLYWLWRAKGYCGFRRILATWDFGLSDIRCECICFMKQKSTSRVYMASQTSPLIQIIPWRSPLRSIKTRFVLRWHLSLVPADRFGSICNVLQLDCHQPPSPGPLNIPHWMKNSVRKIDMISINWSNWVSRNIPVKHLTLNMLSTIFFGTHWYFQHTIHGACQINLYIQTYHLWILYRKVLNFWTYHQ